MSELEISEPCDLLLVGGRVIDPESGLDGVRSIGIRGGRIVHIGDDDVAARERLDVAGLVVSPGFIDLHSHAQTKTGLRLQAMDGVTTSLELEAGALPVAAYYESAEQEGRPINFGFSAGWAYARMHVLDGVPMARPRDDDDYKVAINMFAKNQDGSRWRGPASTAEVGDILRVVRNQLEDGAIGIGVLAGYSPDSSGVEFDDLAKMAAEFDQPLFVHARYMASTEPHSALDAVAEIVRASETFSAPIHLCHMNSTSGQLTSAVAERLLKAQAGGARVTTEVYPYSAGSTVIGAAFLAPEQLAKNHLQPKSIIYLKTAERIATKKRLAEVRTEDAGGACVVEFFDEQDPAELDQLMRALTFPGAAVASDSMPMTFSGEEHERTAAEAALRGDIWPLPPGLAAHPRSSGCFAKTFSWLVREKSALTLPEAIKRCTLIPANILASAAPALKNKGRLRVGADADITVFDPANVEPQGDYWTLRPSRGFLHVLVGGIPVVTGGELNVDALPGRAIKGQASAKSDVIG